MRTLRKFIPLMFVWAILAQEVPSTTWSRDFLRSSSATVARGKIGLGVARDPATVYDAGTQVYDATGIYVGDGTTAGGVLFASPSFSLAATETFSRTGAAYDILDGTSVADGVKSTRTIRYPRWSQEPGMPVTKVTMTGKSLVGVTKLGTLLAGNSSSGNSVMYRSTDMGQSWTTIRAGSAGTGYWCRKVVPINGPTKEILLAYLTEANPTIIVSVDDGATWSSQLLSAAEYGGMTYVTGDFLSLFLVEAKDGVAIADCKLLMCPYGGKLSRNSASEAVLGANRVFRSTATLTQIEAGTAPGFEMLWKANMADLYGASVNGSPGFALKTANTLVAVTTADSGTINSITKTGAFGSISANRSYVEITGGAGAGSVRLITSATADTITAGANFSATADATTEFRVVDLEAISSALHLHSAAYDGTADALYLGFGDTSSRNIAKIAGCSALTGTAIASDVAGQPVNWSASSLISSSAQPTSLLLTGTKVVVRAADGNFCGYYDSSDGAHHGTLWDYFAPSTTAQLYQTYDGIRLNGVDVVTVAASSSEGGLFMGDSSTFDGLMRVARGTTSYGTISGNGNWCGSATIDARVESMDSFTGIYLGAAQSNLAPNWDFSLGTSNPTRWTGSLSGVTTSRDNTYTPLFGGNYVWRWVYSSGTPSPEGYATNTVDATGVYEFSIRVRGSKAPVMYADIFWYTNTTYISNDSGTHFGQANLTNDWMRVSVKATAPNNANACRMYVRSGSAWSSGWLDVTSPTLVKTPQTPISPGDKGAETLRETYASSAFSLNLRTKLEFYVRPVVSSLLTATRTEDICSVESQDGQRVLIQYTDDGAGNKAFLFNTYTSGGVLIASTSLGYIRHYVFDVFRVRVRHEQGLLRCTIETPSESISGAQAWIGPWWPKLVAYGENQWTPGTRYIGWYAHAGVKQQ